MRVVVRRWGNSAAVRIPAAIMEAARITLDQPVDVREEEGRIIIEKLRPESADLAVLIGGITDDNRHDCIETAPPVGQEIW